MDIEYFKEKIFEELDDAKDYIIRAIEIKPMQASWSKTLSEMSAHELNHATYLNNMFNEYCAIMSNSYPNLPDYVKEIRSEIAEKYAKCSTEVKLMHEALK